MSTPQLSTAASTRPKPPIRPYDSTPYRSDARSDLRAEAAAGRFRADLYYRLNGLTVTLPPLRQRADLAALIGRILAREAPEGPPVLSAGLQAAFARHGWPGNIRELASVLRTACLLRDPDETELDWRHLPEEIIGDLRGTAPPREAARSLRAHSDAIILNAIKDAEGNMAQAARRLGISRNTLYRRRNNIRTE